MPDTLRILHGYGIKNYPLSVIAETLKEIYEKEQSNILFDTWKSLYPYMQMGWMKFISFDEFKDSMYSENYQYSNLSADEIEEEINNVFGLEK